MPAMPWWAMLFFLFVMPLLQPVTQFGANKLQKTSNGPQQPQSTAQQQTQPQPYITYHEGRWWKLENGQWYVWTEKK